MKDEVSKLSPAKINLYLEIINRRNDGFHNIESLMTFCNYGDIITVKRSNKFIFKIKGPFSSSLKMRENLIEKTIRELEKIYQRKFLVSIDLKKNLPISSGMGGGSSNAATVIKCIKEIFQLDEPEYFKRFLLSLGADVPFCYYGQTALVSGIGENLDFVENMREFYILLINPKIEISTKEIFSGLKVNSKNKNTFPVTNLMLSSIGDIMRRNNDLENYIVKINNEILEILNNLKSYKGCLLSRMTGSGATCFGLFDSINDLDCALVKARRKFKNYWIKSTKLINSIKHI
tara:strand:+ start:112 stop:981 length:870 start_codon:yes stop_codon:yes gene_type:complete